MSRVENQIISRLRDRLGTAMNVNEMFRVFSKFNALFVWPKVCFLIIVFLLASCLSTIMKTDLWCHPRILIDSAKEDIKHLHEKVHTTQKKQPPISNFLSSSRPNTDSQKPTTCHRCEIYHPSQEPWSGLDRSIDNCRHTWNELKTWMGTLRRRSKTTIEK